MILPFSTKFPDGTPTYFIEKIWMELACHHPSELVTKDDYENAYFEKIGANWGYPNVPFFPKRHTIREDLHDRWKPGMKIHMVVFNRSKNRVQFAPVLECKSVQYVRIIQDNYLTGKENDPCLYIGDQPDYEDCMPFYYKGYGETEMEQLAKNDGFNSVEHFFSWFNKDFNGKIIHWTDLKY